jgi:hypothetical protein
MTMTQPQRPHRVVIVGSGFGGLFAARALDGAPVDVTLIARTSHHLFQPLLYQVATGILSSGEVAPATREILKRQRNVTVLLGDVEKIDVEARTVTSAAPERTTVTPYDSLILAAGSAQSYFGHDEFSEFAPGMKSIDDALELRGRIFGARSPSSRTARSRATSAASTPGTPRSSCSTPPPAFCRASPSGCRGRRRRSSRSSVSKSSSTAWSTAWTRPASTSRTPTAATAGSRP